MLTLEATLQAVDEIEKTVETAACGWKNDDAINAIKLQTRNLRWGRSDPYIREKVGIIEAYTDILYSPRKAERYQGSDAVKKHAEHDSCNRGCRGCAKELQAALPLGDG